MRIGQLELALKASMKVGKPVFIWGEKGLGKTQATKQFAKSIGYKYIPVYLGTNGGVEDIQGMPYREKDVNGVETGVTKYARPKWFPTEENTLIHLDEFNRCHPDIAQSMLSFVQLGVFGDHVLPKNTLIVATGNYDNDRYITTNINDAALIGRFMHVDVEPDVAGWVNYAEKEKCNEAVVDFIKDNPSHLAIQHKDGLNYNMFTPDPRNWLEVISILETMEEVEPIRYELYKGIIGLDATAAFLEYKRSYQKRLAADEVLYHYYSVRDRVREYSTTNTSRLDQLNMVLEQILLQFDDNSIKSDSLDLAIANFKEFLIDVPLELAHKACNRIQNSKFKSKNKILNDLSFATRLARAKEEAAAKVRAEAERMAKEKNISLEEKHFDSNNGGVEVETIQSGVAIGFNSPDKAENNPEAPVDANGYSNFADALNSGAPIVTDQNYDSVVDGAAQIEAGKIVAQAEGEKLIEDIASGKLSEESAVEDEESSLEDLEAVLKAAESSLDKEIEEGLNGKKNTEEKTGFIHKIKRLFKRGVK